MSARSGSADTGHWDGDPVSIKVTGILCYKRRVRGWDLNLCSGGCAATSLLWFLELSMVLQVHWDWHVYLLSFELSLTSGTVPALPFLYNLHCIFFFSLKKLHSIHLHVACCGNVHLCSVPVPRLVFHPEMCFPVLSSFWSSHFSVTSWVSQTRTMALLCLGNAALLRQGLTCSWPLLEWRHSGLLL